MLILLLTGASGRVCLPYLKWYAISEENHILTLRETSINDKTGWHGVPNLCRISRQ